MALIGHAGAKNNGFSRFDGTSGKLLKNRAETVALGSEASGVLPVANGGSGVTVASKFIVYLSEDQSIPNATQMKVTFNVEGLDNNNNFDSTTNYRFQPTIPPLTETVEHRSRR
ncbi:hypothetical protein X566_17635 [Afipia sp. P52-10]|nr:hypothetical protein X566_17635 [Afipia sp. P52-10]